MVNFHPAEGVLMVNFYSSIAKPYNTPCAVPLGIEFTVFTTLFNDTEIKGTSFFYCECFPSPVVTMHESSS